MNEDAEHEAIARWLACEQAYPHRPDHVEQIETHISRVYIAGGCVYKLKKPVKYDFLDYTTVQNREYACREEVRLNRRLAPDAYLEVVPVVRDPAGEYRLGGSGDIADWLVKMRRLPTELTLDALHRRGELRPEHIDRLAAVLVRFYRSLPAETITAQDYRSRYAAHVRGNLRELLAVKHHLPRGVVERVHGFQLQLLQFQPQLFDERVSAGRIVDGHGDLRPEHICLGEPIAIFDCIEFSADFRRIDVADELAFLAAECDFLGATWVGPQLVAAYAEQSGDRPPRALLDFYKCYRACVRAKVAALRAAQLAGSAQAKAAGEARRHLELADEYARPWLRPLVLAVGGVAGTGKTTLAAAVAERLGAELLRTDVIRKETFELGSSSSIAGGMYSREGRERVYDELLRRAAALHAEQISVVLDGTFSTVETLERARCLAVDPRGIFLAVECICRPETAHQRIGQRLAAGHDASDATPEIHERQRRDWQPWPSGIPQVQIDTEQPLDTQLKQVLSAIALRLANGLD